MLNHNMIQKHSKFNALRNYTGAGHALIPASSITRRSKETCPGHPQRGSKAFKGRALWGLHVRCAESDLIGFRGPNPVNVRAKIRPENSTKCSCMEKVFFFVVGKECDKVVRRSLPREFKSRRDSVKLDVKSIMQSWRSRVRSRDDKLQRQVYYFFFIYKFVLFCFSESYFAYVLYREKPKYVNF